MNIKNKYCRLSDLTLEQVDKLVDLMPETPFFDFQEDEFYIGFNNNCNSGTWQSGEEYAETITYKEMLSLLGVDVTEELVPHVHYKEIIAWANGEEIEILLRKSSPPLWVPRGSPIWDLASSYRVKPKTSPTQRLIAEKEKELSALKYQDSVERGVNVVLGEVDDCN
jgi:hypothetical protein